MFALLRNPTMVVPGCFTGHVVSRHRTVAAARKAQARANRACRKANGPSTWLDLQVGQIEADFGQTARITTSTR